MPKRLVLAFGAAVLIAAGFIAGYLGRSTPKAKSTPVGALSSVYGTLLLSGGPGPLPGHPQQHPAVGLAKMQLISVSTSGARYPIRTDTKGRFSVALPAGRYLAVLGWDSRSVPAEPFVFEVIRGVSSTLTFYESVP